MIRARGIVKRYGTLEVLRGVDFDAAQGEVVAVVGKSGAGKTTLLHILSTLLQADAGAVEVGGMDVTRLKGDALARFRAAKIGFVFQAHHLLPEFTALENVQLAAEIAGVSRAEAKKRSMELLEAVGLADRASHKPSALSGGEAQRVAVARALVNRPAVVFADEPSGSLDSASKETLHHLIFSLRDRLGQTFVLVTHDEELAARCDRRVRLADGVVEG